jgi:hypothetical protein
MLHMGKRRQRRKPPEAEKKPVDTASRTRRGVNFNVWVDPELGRAFEEVLGERPKISRTAGIEAAIEAFLRQRGRWPRPRPKGEQD